MEVKDGVLSKVTYADIELLEENPAKFWKGVTSIGSGAFHECKNLTSITIPENITSIGDYAFFSCENLTSITIPESVTRIGEETFSYCKKLTSITIPESVTSIGDRAFDRCKNLASINIPERVTSIGNGTFSYCEKLTSITIPVGVTSIGDLAFDCCKNLASINIPERVTSIGNYAFDRCENLASITIPKNVTSIGNYAFGRCENLKSITIPESVTSIGNYAFCRCENLKSITIPESVTSIEKDAFDGCENLKTVTLPNGRSYFFPCINGDEIMEFIENLDRYSNYVENFIPTENVDELEEKGLLGGLQNFKQYKTLFKKFDGENETDSTNLHDFVNLGLSLGLFSNKTIDFKTAGGKVTKQKVSDLAFNVLQKMLSEGISISEMHQHFSALHPTEPNVEFLNFLSGKTTLSEVIEEEKKNPGFVTRTLDWFENRKTYDLSEAQMDMPNSEQNRYKVQVMSTSEDGVDRLHWQTPTVKNLKMEFVTQKFVGVTSETRDIAEAISLNSNYSQRHFDKAVEIEKERKAKGTPTRLTKKKVGQTIDDAWKKYFEETETLREEIVAESEKVVATQASAAHKIFTYEMLEKNDPMFYNIGSLTSCCARLFGAGAGAQRATIVSPDMQALAIRDSKGKITAFSIVYVNRDEQYAVLNDIEVDKTHEGNKEELDAIYKATVDGVHAFVEEYDREEDERAAEKEGYVAKPLKKVTCGTSPNWYGGINERIQNNPQSQILPAPDFDDYKYVGSGSWSGDWHRSQYVIYDKEKSMGKGEENGRKK